MVITCDSHGEQFDLYSVYDRSELSHFSKEFEVLKEILESEV